MKAIKSSLLILVLAALAIGCQSESIEDKVAAARLEKIAADEKLNQLLAELAASQDTTANEDEGVRFVNVETEAISPDTFIKRLRLVGVVRASKDIMMSAEVTGPIQRYFVGEGDRVQKGQPILKIDDAILKQQIAQAEALEKQNSENYLRLKKVWEEDQIGSEIDYINARHTWEQSKAALDQLNIQLAKTTVRAPFTGVFEAKIMDVGEMVSPGSQMLRLIANDKVKIVTGVPSRYVEETTVGDSVFITFDVLPGKVFTGAATYVGNSIDPQNRTFRMEIELPNNDNQLKVDLVADVIVETGRITDTVILGQEYIFRTESGYQVYVPGYNDNNKLVALSRLVELGPSQSNRVVIQSGLQAGESIITLGSGEVENQTRIRIMNGPGPASVSASADVSSL